MITLADPPKPTPPSEQHRQRATVELFALIVASALVPVLTTIGALDKWLQYALGGAVAMLIVSFGISTLRVAFYRGRRR